MPTTPRRNIQKASQSRLFTFDGGAGPGTVPVYQGLAIGKQLNYALGARTPVRIPSSTRYGSFEIVESIRAQRGLPTLGIDNRLTRDRSELLSLALKGCEIDLQLHIGTCTDPTDFAAFEKIMVLESAVPTDYQTSELGAFDGNQESSVLETLPFEGINYYEIVPINGQEIAAEEILQEIVAVAIADVQTCGECGLPNDGSEIAFALTVSHGGSPGLPAELLFTVDGWQTVQSTLVDTMELDDPTGMAIVGTNLVIISADRNALEYAPIVDILNGVELWTENATGFVNGPLAIFSLGASFTWIVGNGGYVYFSDDITAGVQVQSDGSVTSEDLHSVHAFDSLHVLVVGNNNAVMITDNGGSGSWSALIGPEPGVNLTACWMRGEFDWMVGSDDGVMSYTRDGGFHWAATAFTAAGTGSIRAIAFSTPTVGYFIHNVAGHGYLLRSVSGGAKWYRLPEAPGRHLPDQQQLDALAVTAADFSKGPNYALAGGLAIGGLDGILMKVA